MHGCSIFTDDSSVESVPTEISCLANMPLTKGNIDRIHDGLHNLLIGCRSRKFMELAAAGGRWESGRWRRPPRCAPGATTARCRG
jgi:hypothetical protein